MEFLPQDAAEWIVCYSALGWTVGSVGGEATLNITEEMAIDAIGAIRRASAGNKKALLK